MSVIDIPVKERTSKRKKVIQTSNEPNIKEEAKAMIDRLPDDLTWDRLIYHITVRMSVERGLNDIEDGDYYTEEEVDAIIEQWEKEDELLGQSTP